MWGFKPFKFRVGQYFRANVCGDRPIAKVLDITRHAHAPRGSWVIQYTWGRGHKSLSPLDLCTMTAKLLENVYAINGPLEEVPRLRGMLEVGE
jgi:hypothetical protein